MSKTSKLEEGEMVTVNIPFTYTIGEEGPITGKILRTIEDCENEVRAEVEQGMDTLNMSLDSEAH
jgi:hypothetical protein